jgi:hypothetical protein
MRGLFAITIVVSLACSHAVGQRNVEAEIARVSLTNVDPAGEFTVVFGPAVAMRWREEVLRLRPAATLQTVDEMKYLPERVLRIDSIVAEGDHAVFKAWLGPVPRPIPNFIIDACGTGVVLELGKRDAGWHVTGGTRTVC